MYALDDGGIRALSRKFVVRVNAFHDEYLALEFDLTGHLAGELSAACVDAARFQRAPEGPGQSPGGRGHEIVESRGIRGEILRRDAVVLGDF